ncbi:MAG: YqaJ viral recombinase family protein [Burkholderiales bacterium]|nr:YqaJ viral recombinase family protein [Burkholderiales bacterium]
MKFNKINVIQGTPEWRNWRKSGITATDMIKIFTGKHTTKQRLIDEKLDLIAESTYSNQAMENGHLGEELTIDLLQFENFAIEHGYCISNKENPHFLASLDGINQIDGYLVEIKSPTSPTSKYFTLPVPDSAVYIQIQWQLLVSGYDRVRYCVFYDGQIVIDEFIYADDLYQFLLIKSANSFWNQLKQIKSSGTISTDSNEIDVRIDLLKDVEDKLANLTNYSKKLRSELEQELSNTNLKRYSNQLASVTIVEKIEVDTQIYDDIVNLCGLNELYKQLTDKHKKVLIDFKPLYAELLTNEDAKIKYDELSNKYSTLKSSIRVNFEK